MSFMDSIGSQAASQAFSDPGSFDLGHLGEFATEAAVTVGVAYATAQFGPVGGALASQAAESLTGGGQSSIGDMEQGDFFDALKDVVSQIGRESQKETKKSGGEGEGEAGEIGEAAGGAASEIGGGDSGASLRDLAEALGKAVSDRVAAAKEKVSALTADSDQGQILEATSEVGAAGFLATSAGGAMQSAIQGTNELARKG
jgi:hypothetical protein